MNAWDRFLLAITPDSDAEKRANLSVKPDYYGSASSTIANQVYGGGIGAEFDAFNQYYPAPTSPTMPSDEGLSLWDKFKIAIMPTSYGEQIANEIIYSPIGAEPIEFDVQDFSSPNVYVNAKAAVKEGLQIAGAGLKTYATYVFIALIVLLVLYVGVPALI